MPTGRLTYQPAFPDPIPLLVTRDGAISVNGNCHCYCCLCRACIVNTQPEYLQVELEGGELIDNTIDPFETGCIELTDYTDADCQTSNGTCVIRRVCEISQSSPGVYSDELGEDGCLETLCGSVPEATCTWIFDGLDPNTSKLPNHLGCSGQVTLFITLCDGNYYARLAIGGGSGCYSWQKLIGSDKPNCNSLFPMTFGPDDYVYYLETCIFYCLIFPCTFKNATITVDIFVP
jgi:hypothetical protein